MRRDAHRAWSSDKTQTQTTGAQKRGKKTSTWIVIKYGVLDERWDVSKIRDVTVWRARGGGMSDMRVTASVWIWRW